MPKLPAAGTCPSSILARTPDTSPIHRVVPVQVVMPGGHAPLALRADARRCSSRQSLATLDALHAPARVGAVARLVPTARIIFASHLCSPLTSQEPAGCGPHLGPNDNLQVPGRTPDSMPRAIDPRVFCRPTRALETGVLRQSAGFRTTSARPWAGSRGQTPAPRPNCPRTPRPGRRGILRPASGI